MASARVEFDIFAYVGQGNALVGGYDYSRDGQRRAQQTEDERHGGRGGQPEGVVYVEQDYIGQHNRQIEDHNLSEREVRGVEHSAARHLHHAARRDGPDDYSDGCHGHDDLKRRGFRRDGRVEEIGRIVHHADEKARDREDNHHHEHESIDMLHSFESICKTKIRHKGRSDKKTNYLLT